MRSTKEEFIEKARTIHGDRYDYSKVEYMGSDIDVVIICPIHGEFLQTPHSHLRGCGCKQCAIDAQVQRQKLSLEEWITKANKKHNNKYDYSLIKDYTRGKQIVQIICPKHGVFEQRAEDHLFGHGCRRCAIDKSIENIKLTTEEWIKKAKKVHGDRYDYSKVEYKGWDEKVCIICHEKDKNGVEHGEFWQNANAHLYGRGCNKCNSRHLEQDIISLLTKHNIKFEYTKRDFPWLKYKKSLELDFYLPDYNVAIECQGVQHFESLPNWGGDEAFQDRLIRDNIKQELCEKHGIKLYYYSDLGIVYPYHVFENKDYLLETIINGQKNTQII